MKNSLVAYVSTPIAIWHVRWLLSMLCVGAMTLHVTLSILFAYVSEPIAIWHVRWLLSLLCHGAVTLHVTISAILAYVSKPIAIWDARWLYWLCCVMVQWRCMLQYQLFLHMFQNRLQFDMLDDYIDYVVSWCSDIACNNINCFCICFKTDCKLRC